MTDYPTAWERYDPKGLGIYGAEAKCWEHAVFTGDGIQVGQSVDGTIGYTGRSEDVFSQYGLVRKQRQVRAYVPKAPRTPERRETHEVRSETYDVEGKLVELKVEKRMVYWNSKGPYIKTRGSGNIRITDPDTMTITYRQARRMVGRRMILSTFTVAPKGNS